MADLQINVYAFLGVLEFALLLVIISLIFVVRSNKLLRRLRRMQGKLKKARQLPEAITFDHYLRDELIHNQGLMERAAESQDDAEKQVVELMGFRKRYLELEVEARACEKDPLAFRDKLAAGLSELIECVRPDAKIVMESVAEAVETSPPVEQAAEQTQTVQRNLLDTHDEEFDRLKKVIHNQQDAMQALRKTEIGEGDKQQLKNKLQELEALLEFKDAAIEELEKKCSKLEAGLLAASGEKQVD